MFLTQNGHVVKREMICKGELVERHLVDLFVLHVINLDGLHFFKEVESLRPLVLFIMILYYNMKEILYRKILQVLLYLIEVI